MDSHADDARVAHTQKLRDLNDRLRRTFQNGRVVLTRAVADQDPAITLEVVKAVRKFEAFTPDNDPHGEHDFGQVEVSGQSYFWKIDAYDVELEFASPDPTDDAVTTRVLTIMTPSDL